MLLRYFLYFFCLSSSFSHATGNSIDLNDEELGQIKRYANYLKGKTTPNDLVLFVGRSPWAVKACWDIQNVNRNYLSVSYSGKAYEKTSLREIEPSYQELEAYKCYLNSVGITNAINEAIKKPENSIVLVDYTASGGGIGSFAKLMTVLY